MKAQTKRVKKKPFCVAHNDGATAKDRDRERIAKVDFMFEAFKAITENQCAILLNQAQQTGRENLTLEVLY